MKNRIKFRLPESIFVSASVTEDEINEISNSVVEIAMEEIEKIRDRSLELAFVREANDTREKFYNIIPLILSTNNLSIQKFNKHCRSCIITEGEINEMAALIHEKWMMEMTEKFPENELKGEVYSDYKPFESLSLEVQKYYFEFVYIIPIIFKKSGYEIIRKSEVRFMNIEIAEKMARTIHSRYRKSMGSANDNSGNIYEKMYLVNTDAGRFTEEFDDLDEDIKLSNIDNAYHIPSKLLSIGYKIEGWNESDIEIPLLSLTEQEVETMARIEHDRWCWDRRLSGWTYSEKRDNNNKHHNCLVPFDDLSEDEKEKDRVLVRFIPYILKDIGLGIVPVSPEIAASISYIKKEWGCISELKTSISRLKSMITEDTTEAIRNELSNVEMSIDSLKNAFTSGKKVQSCFLPSILEFKEYLPDSFVMYKPKDIVSGDFFFIAKPDKKVILAAADCTGHGISAAILTAICYNFLDLAIRKRKIADPAGVLKSVIRQTEDFLRQDLYDTGSKFGMDITVCSLDPEENILCFSGFGNPLYYFSDGVLNVTKGISSLSRFDKIKRMIETTSIQLKKGDSFYIFSDGYADQEKENGKRFQQHRFRDLLTAIQQYPMHEQCEKLNRSIEEWRRSINIHQPQTDDILVIGVKI